MSFSRIALLCILAGIALAANYTIPSGSCGIADPMQGNKTASLSYFAGNTTVGDHIVAFSCEFTAFPNCMPWSGFAAIYSADGKCSAVYNVRKSLVFDDETPGTFIYSLQTTHETTPPKVQSEETPASILDGVSPNLELVFVCSPGVDSKVGTVSGDTIFYRTEAVCAGYDPATTKAPFTAAPISTTVAPSTAVPTTTQPNMTINTTGCSVTWNDKNASLSYFTGNATVGNETIGVSPCEENLFPGCGTMKGYIATYTLQGACDRVYDEKGETQYDTSRQEFRTVYSSTFFQGTEHGMAGESLTLVVRCQPGVDTMEGRRQGDSLVFNSETACLGYAPATVAPTPMPTPPPEDSGLSAGAIAGIVIACIAFVIIVIVVVRIKLSTSDDDANGEYQRV